MRLFKPTYKSKRGKSTKVQKWWIEVVDRREKRFRKVLRLPVDSKEGLSGEVGRKIQSLIDNNALGLPDIKAMQYLEDYAPAKLKPRLRDLGLLPKIKAQVDKPLIDYLPAFKKAIFEESKDSLQKKTTTGDASAKAVTAKVRKIIGGCGFKVSSDLASVEVNGKWKDLKCGPVVNEYIEGRPDKMSQQTAHVYVQAFRRFGGWMFERGYINREPKIRSVPTAKNFRRCFELAEFTALLKATRTGPELYDMTGYQRYVLYLLTVETGLRRGELRSLTVGSIDFKNGCASVQGGPAGATKNKRQAVQFITPETLKVLKQFTRGKMPNVKLFDNIPDKSAKMLREDCKAAGIKTDNHKGKIQFHCLRNTCGSYLAAQGINPNTIKDIMRHQDIRLTMDRYVRELDGATKQAVNMMPRFTAEKSA